MGATWTNSWSKIQNLRLQMQQQHEQLAEFRWSSCCSQEQCGSTELHEQLSHENEEATTQTNLFLALKMPGCDQLPHLVRTADSKGHICDLRVILGYHYR